MIYSIIVTLFAVGLAGTLVRILVRGLKFNSADDTMTIDTTSLTRMVPPSPNTAHTARVRMAAEWEPALGVLIGWPLRIPIEVVKEIVSDDRVFIILKSEKLEIEAKAELQANNIDLDRVTFIQDPEAFKHVQWTRDWGPYGVFDEAGQFKITQSRFMGYTVSGPKNTSPAIFLNKKLVVDMGDKGVFYSSNAAVADSLGVKQTQLSSTLTGGNIMTDGRGTAISTRLVLNENRVIGISEGKFFDAVQRDLGITRYVIIPNFERIGIQHIDCLLKLLDEETIMVARVPENDAAYESIEATVEQLSTLASVHGRPYKIVRIDTPHYMLKMSTAYTNSLIINKKVLVPLFGIPGDKKALETWREAMPGYRVIGFRFSGTRFAWKGFDALHCRTRAIWDPEMLYMTHERLDEALAPADSYDISVRIRDYSRAGLVPEALRLSWRLLGEADWHSEVLASTDDPEVFRASIPRAESGQTLEYFLAAADCSGRKEFLPRTAPDGFYSATVVS